MEVRLVGGDPLEALSLVRHTRHVLVLGVAPDYWLIYRMDITSIIQWISFIRLLCYECHNRSVMCVCCLNWYLLKLKFTWRAAGAPKRSRWTRPSSRIRNLVDLEYVNRAYRLQWQNKQPIAWWHFSEFTIGLSFNKSSGIGIQWHRKQLNACRDTFPNFKWCHLSIWTEVRIRIEVRIFLGMCDVQRQKAHPRLRESFEAITQIQSTLNTEPIGYSDTGYSDKSVTVTLSPCPNTVTVSNMFCKTYMGHRGSQLVVSHDKQLVFVPYVHFQFWDNLSKYNWATMIINQKRVWA